MRAGRHSRTLATAARKLLTFRDRHNAEVAGKGQ